MNCRPTNWSEAMDTMLRQYWFRYSIARCAELLHLSPDRVTSRAKRLGLPGRKSKEYRDRLTRVWMAAATKEAEVAKVSLRDILSGVKRPEIVIARWKAFQAVMSSGECPSVTALAYVSGFDHSAILYGIARNDGMTRKYRKTEELPHGRSRRIDPDGIRSIGEVFEDHLSEIVRAA